MQISYVLPRNFPYITKKKKNIHCILHIVTFCFGTAVMCKPTNVLKCFEFVCGYYVQYDRREMMGVAGMTKHCD